MSRRQFMARTSVAIDALVTELALTPSEQAGVKTRTARYNRDCGCAMGGVFLVAALVTFLVYMAVTAALAIDVIGAGIAFVVVSSLLGKTLGLVVASVRLGMLRRSLSRRARRTSGESHVYVH